MYLLTCDDTTKNARTLAYAKALAPYMFTRLGTQAMFKAIKVTDEAGALIALYTRKGWVDNPALYNQCPECDNYKLKTSSVCISCELVAAREDQHNLNREATAWKIDGPFLAGHVPEGMQIEMEMPSDLHGGEQ